MNNKNNKELLNAGLVVGTGFFLAQAAVSVAAGVLVGAAHHIMGGDKKTSTKKTSTKKTSTKKKKRAA